MTTNNTSVVLKILIDYSEYQRLKECEKEIKKIHNLKKKELEIPNFSKQEDTLEQSEVPNQSGFGNNITSDFISQISKAVSDQLANEYNLKQLQTLLTNSNSETKQTGTGFEDLLPNKIDHVDLDITPLPASENIIEKSIPHDDFDTKKLINLVPLPFHKKAQLLLQKINEFPLDITYNTAGDLFINSQSIPNANIYEIFPNLYKKRSKKHIPGFEEMVNKLAELNLGYLFTKGILKTLKRPKHYKIDPCINENYKKVKYWWFIGD